MEKKQYKAIIRVVKSVKEENFYSSQSSFGFCNQLKEPLILANSKKEVKEYLVKKYPQFFPGNKIFQRETKDQTQFFYVLIYELWKNEKDLIRQGEWHCSFCKQSHENQYIDPPVKNVKLFGEDKLFCNNLEDDIACISKFHNKKFEGLDLGEDLDYINEDSLNYIYKITEKNTNKCYIGKTRNAPFFRWWNHLKHSSTPFGKYFSKKMLSDWTFEVLEIMPSGIKDSEVFKVETEYMNKFNSIENGFNSLASSKLNADQLVLELKEE